MRSLPRTGGRLQPARPHRPHAAPTDEALAGLGAEAVRELVKSARDDRVALRAVALPVPAPPGGPAADLHILRIERKFVTPARPRNGWVLFMQHQRELFRGSVSDGDSMPMAAEVLREWTSMWRAVRRNVDEYRLWAARADADALRYVREMREYTQLMDTLAAREADDRARRRAKAAGAEPRRESKDARSGGGGDGGGGDGVGSASPASEDTPTCDV